MLNMFTFENEYNLIPIVPKRAQAQGQLMGWLAIELREDLKTSDM